MKLFKSGLGSKEQDKALSREKFFIEEYGPLAAEWNQQLISSGMDPDQALDQYGRRDLPDTYSAEQEHQFATYARWAHKADSSRFSLGRQGHTERNRQIWALYARGETIRSIMDNLDLKKNIVETVIEKLRERCHEDVRAGVCDADTDSRAEINQWTRLQAIKQKHLTMLRNGTLAETIADSVIESGCLIKLPIDQDVVDALNEATAQISLALAAGE
jgi:DNA-binding CsgD family transcriptional regulator